MRSNGKFIVVDGGEGSGKGTLLASLQESLPEDSAIFTREPGGTLISESVRNLLKSDLCKDANALTNFLLFWAARSDLVEKVIAPSVKNGVNVVCDRYDMSTFAYQIRGQENPALMELFFMIRAMFDHEVQPDLYIYLDVDPVEGYRRTSGRGEQDHFDKRGMEFHYRVREGYLEFGNFYPVVIIDANRPFDEVRGEFFEVIQQQLVLEPALE